MEELPSFRKLSIQSFIGRPNARLARYPLLLKALHKATFESNPDRENVRKLIEKFEELLRQIDERTGKFTNIFKIEQIYDRIRWKEGLKKRNLDLQNSRRNFIRDGILTYRSSVENKKVLLYLFDNVLILAKERETEFGEQIIYIHKKPIFLEYALIVPEDSHLLLNQSKVDPSKQISKFSICLMDLENERMYSFYATTMAAQNEWMQTIQEQIDRRKSLLKIKVSPKVSFYCSLCIVKYKGKYFLGRSDGIYVVSSATSSFRVIKLDQVTKIGIVDDQNIAIVLSARRLLTIPLAHLDGLKQPSVSSKKISNHVDNFFIYLCNGKKLIFAVKRQSSISQIKVYEFLDSKLRILFKNKTKLYRKIFIGSKVVSLKVLNNRLVIACAHGFELMDLHTMQSQELLDPSDSDLQFALSVNSKALDVFQLEENKFLLCFDRTII